MSYIMKILTNRKIKHLFCITLAAIIFACCICLVCVGLNSEHAALYILFTFAGLCAVILAAMYLYFKDQGRLMDNAAEQIKEYISGNRNARIECNDEGGLYRLFHEVNSLVAILNAHTENERRSKIFMKDTISDISHQLKTPLAALNIYNGLIQTETKKTPEIKELADLSEQELDRIETLVKNLLKITKLDAGTVVLEKNTENVSDMMRDIEKHYAYRARHEKKTLSFCGDDSLELTCDRSWIIEAVGNIVKNALDHTKEGDTIQIRWQKFASIVQITVRDTGCGIHPEDMPHIFKRFYRSRFSKDTQGIGLGLPLAKAVIEAHSGTIEVNSELGVGTTFTINFLIPTKL